MSGTIRGELAHPEASAVHAARMAHGVRIVFKASKSKRRATQMKRASAPRCAALPEWLHEARESGEHPR
jgi:hypothetical protein